VKFNSFIPSRNKDKVKAEERQIEELEAPLKEKDEGAHLKRKLETPPGREPRGHRGGAFHQIAKASSLAVRTRVEACPLSPKEKKKLKS
jgi:hypothetical protein